LLLLNICDQEFIECEWNFLGKDEALEVHEEQQEVYEKQILRG